MSYQHPGIRARAKRERRDPALLPFGVFEEQPGIVACHDTKVVLGRLKVVGECVRHHPFAGTAHPAERVEVTRNDGVVVPCTRLKGGNYVLVQDRSYKAARP